MNMKKTLSCLSFVALVSASFAATCETQWIDQWNQVLRVTFKRANGTVIKSVDVSPVVWSQIMDMDADGSPDFVCVLGPQSPTNTEFRIYSYRYGGYSWYKPERADAWALGKFNQNTTSPGNDIVVASMPWASPKNGIWPNNNPFGQQWW